MVGYWSSLLHCLCICIVTGNIFHTRPVIVLLIVQQLEFPAQLPCLLQIAMCSALCNDSILQYNPDNGNYEKIGESTEVAFRVLAEKVGFTEFFPRISLSFLFDVTIAICVHRFIRLVFPVLILCLLLWICWASMSVLPTVIIIGKTNSERFVVCKSDIVFFICKWFTYFWSICVENNFLYHCLESETARMWHRTSLYVCRQREYWSHLSGLVACYGCLLMITFIIL